ncbi:MAG: antibiotic biosynthesis monooxygenase [Pseudomonadota bacterium]
MVTKGLLVRFESRDRSDDDVRKLLLAAKPLVEREPATTVWFAIRFGRGEFGVFDAFADEAGRKAHLQGAMASALMSAKDSLLAGMPTITQLDVVERRPATLTTCRTSPRDCC